MTDEKGITRYVWPVIVILALFLIGLTLIEISLELEHIMSEYALKMSGSSLTMESLDEGAVKGFGLFVGGALFQGVWFGIFGLFCAWGVKRKESFAWRLGILWSVLLIAHGIITALNELFVVKWPTVCPVVLEFLIVGVIALGCLLIVRKEFT